MNKELIIEPPDGYEIDKEKSTFERIIFKEIKNKMVKSFYDLDVVTGFWIDKASIIPEKITGVSGNENRNVWPTKKLAEAALALSQLMQLRQRAVGDWTVNLTNIPRNYAIINIGNTINRTDVYRVNAPLSFPERAMRDEFMKLHKALLNIAKPLL